MKAIVFNEKNKVNIEDMKTPQASVDRILIETLYSGISWGTETAWLAGKMPFEFPGIPGYLSVGKVLHVGETTGRKDICVGDTVWAGGNHAKFINQVPVVVQPLADGVDLKAVCFCHLAAIGLHCLNRASAKAGETLYVAGQGFLGQLTAQVGKAIGMKVFASDLSPRRIEISHKYSCENVFNSNDPALKKELEKAGGADVIINSTGAAGLEDSLIELLRPFGRLVAQGMTPRVDFSLYDALDKQISVVISADSTQQEDIDCIKFIDEDKLDITPLITTELLPYDAVDWYTKPEKSEILGTIIDWSKI